MCPAKTNLLDPKAVDLLHGEDGDLVLLEEDDLAGQRVPNSDQDDVMGMEAEDNTAKI